MLEEEGSHFLVSLVGGLVVLLINGSGDPDLRSYLASITENIVAGDTEENFFDFVIDCKHGPALALLLSYLPAEVRKCSSEGCLVKIKKSDVMKHMSNMRNPLRYACGDEYSTMLATYMMLDFTSLFKSYAENLYASDVFFNHDMRSGSGRVQEFLNYMGDLHPGRLPHYVFTDSRALSLCFPNPDLLNGVLRFSNNNTSYVICDTKNSQDSILLKAVRMRLVELRKQLRNVQEGKNNFRISAVVSCMERFIDSVSSNGETRLEISCGDFTVVIREIMLDNRVKSFIERELYARQLEYTVDRMQKDFYLGKSLHGGSSGISKKNGDSDRKAIGDAINALESFKKLIDSGRFFERFNQGKGILQAQRYFRCIRAMVDVEIVFLSRNIEKLTKDDLRFFISETCKEVSHDINQLLIVHDYFVTGRTVDRDAVVRVSKSEVKALAGKVQRFVSLYNKIYHELCTGDCPSLEEASARIRQDQRGSLDSWEESLLSLNNLSKIFTNDKEGAWKADDSKRNALLIDKIESHELSEVIHKLNCYEDKEINGCISDVFVGGVTDEKVFDVLRRAVRHRNHEYIVDIECSRLIDCVKAAHKISTYLPFCSLWLPLFSVGRYRTYSSHNESGIKKWVCTKNSLIRHTKFSLGISDGLMLQRYEQRFVSGDHDAEMLCSSFRVQHNISGHKERFAYLLKKYRLVLYILVALLAVSSVTVVVLENLRANFGIVPWLSALQGMCVALKVVFDVAIAVVVLDTVVENFLLLFMNLFGFLIRVVDFILLGGLISRIVGFVFCKFCNLLGKICDGFIGACFQLHSYGLKNSFFLLIDKLFNKENYNCRYPEHEEKKNGQYSPKLDPKALVCENYTAKVIPDVDCGAITDKGEQESFNAIYRSADILSLVFNTSKEHRESLGKSLKRSCHVMASELYGKKAEVSQSLRAFTNAASAPQSTVFHKNYINLRKNFFFLMNSYPEELRLHVVNPKSPTILDSYEKRRDVYDLVASVNLQTAMMVGNKGVIEISLGKSARSFLESAHLTLGTDITLREINEKIAALQWAIASIVASEITTAVKRYEVLFYETKIERSCAIAMMDCIKVLQHYRECLLEGRSVSKQVVSCYIESNFYSYIRDASSLLAVIDKKSALRHNTESYRRFCEIMLGDFSLLEKESTCANRARNILSLDMGVMSSGTKIKQAFIEFVEYFQSPKSILLSFCVYHTLIMMGGKFAEYASRYARLTDNALSAIGFDYVYEMFMQNECSEKILNFFWGSIFPRDAAVIVWEIVKSVSSLNGDDVLSVSREIDHRIYCGSFHRQGDSIEDLKSFFNDVADLFCTITQTHLVKKIICGKEGKACSESLEFFLQRETERSNLLNKPYGSKYAVGNVDLSGQIGTLQCATIHGFGTQMGYGITC